MAGPFVRHPARDRGKCRRKRGGRHGDGRAHGRPAGAGGARLSPPPHAGEGDGPADQGDDQPARPVAGLLARRRRALPRHPRRPAGRPTTTPPRATSSPWSRTAPPCWASATSARWPASRSWRARAACSRSSPASTSSTSRSTRPTRTSWSRSWRRSSPPSAASTSRTSRRPSASRSSRRSARRMQIPVFHDDQHGTAIVAAAALLNGLEVVGKRIGEVKLVCSGAGAAAIACLDLAVGLGVRKENIWITDSKGVVYEGRRQSMDEQKARYAQRHRGPHARRHRRGGGRVLRPLGRGRAEARDGGPDGGPADHPGDGQPRPGDPARGREGRPPGRDHRDGARATTRTRSTTSSASRSSSAARSTSAPPRSTRR